MDSTLDMIYVRNVEVQDIYNFIYQYYYQCYHDYYLN